MIEQAIEQADAGVLFFHQPLAQHVRERQGAQRADRVDEQRVRPVERMNEAAGREARPAVGLHGAAHLERELVEAGLPLARLDAPFAREPPQVSVGADVVEAVVVHAHVGQVRRHPLERARAAEIEELLVAGRVELQQRGAELEALRPLGPAPGLVAPLDGEDGRAVFGPPRVFDREDLSRGDVEDALDARQEIGWFAVSVYLHGWRQVV